MSNGRRFQAASSRSWTSNPTPFYQLLLGVVERRGVHVTGCHARPGGQTQLNGFKAAGYCSSMGSHNARKESHCHAENARLPQARQLGFPSGVNAARPASRPSALGRPSARRRLCARRRCSRLPLPFFMNPSDELPSDLPIDPTTFAFRLMNRPVNRVEGFEHGAHARTYLRRCAEQTGLWLEAPERDEPTLAAMRAAGYASWDKFTRHLQVGTTLTGPSRVPTPTSSAFGSRSFSAWSRWTTRITRGH